MSVYVELQRAKEIKRDETGFPFTWRSGKTIKVFTDGAELKAYIDENIAKMKNVVAFTGSASTLTTVNGYIAKQLKERGII